MVSAEVESADAQGRVDAPAEGPSFAVKCGGGSCGCLLLLFVVFYFAFVPLAGAGIASEFLTFGFEQAKNFTGEGYDLSNIIYKSKWPLCGMWEEGQTIDRFDSGCGDACYDTSFLKDMQISLAASGGQVVSFPSRAEAGIETITLRGWLIPAAGNLSGSATTPRIVVQHGYRSSSNRPWPLQAAWRLSEMGFHVLINNFRDCGYSDDSQAHLWEWGGGYTYDLLGAWDYLRTDPQGLLGGEISADKVGMHGFSMGAFMTLNAFGLESRVPAVWADSPPYNVKKTFLDGASRVSGLLVSLFGEQLWNGIVDMAASKGVDIMKNLPEKNLPMGPATARRLVVTTNPADTLVPFSDYQAVMNLLEQHTDKYDVSTFLTSKTCDEMKPEWAEAGNHVVGILLEPEVYLHHLCNFFRDAFGLDNSDCPALAASASAESKIFVV